MIFPMLRLGFFQTAGLAHDFGAKKSVLLDHLLGSAGFHFA